jgi:hypothetical protein
LLVVSPPLKNISQLGCLFPIYGKIKNVPNHQSNRIAVFSNFTEFQDAQLLLDVIELDVMETREIRSDIIHGLQAHDLSQ